MVSHEDMNVKAKKKIWVKLNSLCDAHQYSMTVRESVQSTHPDSGLSVLCALGSLARVGIGDHLLLILNHNLRSGRVVLHTIHFVRLHIVEIVNEWMFLQVHRMTA